MLTIRNITKTFGNKCALDNVTIHLGEGNCIGLIGSNGAGKSTLIKIIVSIIQSDQGTVQSDYPKRNIGYVPQEICVEEKLTALQNLQFFGKLYQLKGKALQHQTNKVLRYIGLSDSKNEKVKKFSGGMKRRLNIGCALMNNPQLIIMDEPTVGVDPQSRKYILNMINEMKMENKTIIYSTHYMEEAEKICDEVAFIDKGRIIQHNKLEEVLHHHSTAEIYFKFKHAQLNFEHDTAGAIRTYNKGYLITAQRPVDAMDYVLKICKEHQYELEQLELLQPRLEDIFFQLTGNELRA